MNRHSVAVVLVIVGFFIFSFLGMSREAAAVIHIEQEGSGDINKTTTGQQNLNGAMVWNGTEWIVNNTWAHRFFVDTLTGQRLKDYNSKDVTVTGAPDAGTQTSACSGIPSDGYGNFYATDSFGNYGITRQAYVYVKQASSGLGSYCYGAVEYVIHDNITGKEVILKSRGVGGGTSQAYFDVYIDDDVTGGGIQTTAMRGDPAWFTYAGMAASEAKLLTDRIANKSGDLPGAVTKQGTNAGDYYLDQGGGADLGPAGVGKSFELHTFPLTDQFSGLSPSYIRSFELKYMDSNGDLQKITVSPTLFKEVFFPATSTSIPTMTEWGMIIFIALAGLGSIYHLRRQKKSRKIR